MSAAATCSISAATASTARSPSRATPWSATTAMHGGCVRPYHDPSDRSRGGPHDAGAAIADIHGGAMDGFVAQAESGRPNCLSATDPAVRTIPPPGAHFSGPA